MSTKPPKPASYGVKAGRDLRKVNVLQGTGNVVTQTGPTVTGCIVITIKYGAAAGIVAGMGFYLTIGSRLPDLSRSALDDDPERAAVASFVGTLSARPEAAKWLTSEPITGWRIDESRSLSPETVDLAAAIRQRATVGSELQEARSNLERLESERGKDIARIEVAIRSGPLPADLRETYEKWRAAQETIQRLAAEAKRLDRSAELMEQSVGTLPDNPEQADVRKEIKVLNATLDIGGRQEAATLELERYVVGDIPGRWIVAEASLQEAAAVP